MRERLRGGIVLNGQVFHTVYLWISDRNADLHYASHRRDRLLGGAQDLPIFGLQVQHT